MSFAWPWCFLLLPLPWLLRRALPPVAPGAALRVPSLPTAGLAQAVPVPRPALWFAALAWLCLVVAAARPVVLDPRAPPLASGRDLMLAFDVSASMGTADLSLGSRAVDRLQAARMLADSFLQQRPGDRVGLVVFGRQAYLHTPLTFDLEGLRMALAGMETGFAGRETALGDAIGLAVKHLQAAPGPERVLVLLTDGAHTAGTLTPQRAAWLARREGVRIHALGIGAAAAAGAGVDEETLAAVASQTGGIYRRAADSAGMAEFWRVLEGVEPAARAGRAAHGLRELYAWPLAAALVLVTGGLLFRRREAGA